MLSNLIAKNRPVMLTPAAYTCWERVMQTLPS